jgi:hypothetical protein
LAVLGPFQIVFCLDNFCNGILNMVFFFPIGLFGKRLLFFFFFLLDFPIWELNY